MRATLVAVCVVVSAILGGGDPSAAAGPLLVNGAGTPLVWTTLPIPFSPDKGPLGMLKNAEAVALVTSNFSVWAAVPSSSIAFADVGSLAVDVTAANYLTLLGVCDGVSPIVFDDDGGITDDLLGIGARNDVLGFAGPECGDVAAGTITESIAFLNGRFVDGVSSATNPELSLVDFGAVFIHEFGHYFNLDHSQIGLAEAVDEDPTNDAAVATMFPFLVDGEAATSLALDDVVSVSTLYPAAGFSRSTAVIRGRVLRATGAPFQGAYVIARNLVDPRHLAVGFTSGARFAPFMNGLPTPGGPPAPALEGWYDLTGLPPGTYTVEVEPVDPQFTSGSTVGPLDPPALLPGPPEFWNGSAEAATNPPDDPLAATPITVTAGESVPGIDVRLNEPVVPNDECATALDVDAIPFVDTRATGAATTAGDDPEQSCTVHGPDPNAASVWYRLTPPTSARVVVDTLGSDYDTVLTASAGGCGVLTEVACSDDVGAGRQSRVALDVLGGETILLEVTAYHGTPAGTLRFAVRVGCEGNGACDDGDPCTDGDVCTSGACGGMANACDDGNSCTADACDPGIGCGHTEQAGPCDDGDACSLGDTCNAGACTGGARVDALAVLAVLREGAPETCDGLATRRVRIVRERLGRAASRVRHAVAQRGARSARAFARALSSLGRARRSALRIGRRVDAACGAKLLARVETARAQLACVRGDAPGATQ